MKVVWILVHSVPYEGDYLVGAFASEELVLAHTKDAVKRYEDSPLQDPRVKTWLDCSTGAEYWCEQVIES